MSFNPDPFKSLFVDTLYTLDDTQFLIGFANGFVQRISLPNNIILKTYNPLLFQKDDPFKEKEQKTDEKPQNPPNEENTEKGRNHGKKEESAPAEEKKEEAPKNNENENQPKKQKTWFWTTYCCQELNRSAIAT